MTASRQRLRVAIIGLAGSGKSTGAQFIREIVGDRGLTHCTIKLAAPLYAIQARVYEYAGLSLPPAAQDQQLMEAVATSLRRSRPDYLAADFLERLHRTDEQVVINDDLRDPFVDAGVLRREGFQIIRVLSSTKVRQLRLRSRADVSLTDRSTDDIDLIEPDELVVNDTTPERYRAALAAILEGWL